MDKDNLALIITGLQLGKMALRAARDMDRSQLTPEEEAALDAETASLETTWQDNLSKPDKPADAT